MQVLIFLGLAIAYVQATSEAITLDDLIRQSKQECIKEQGYDVNELKELFKNPFLPEDNEKLGDFVFCYWEKVGVLNKEGVFNELRAKTVTPHLIREKYPNVSENEAAQLADQSIDACYRKEDGNFVGRKCILLRNCVVKYIRDRRNKRKE